MQFVYLTHPEVENASIDWRDDFEKDAELVDAAIAAGFSSEEVAQSPIGLLTEDFNPVANMVFLKGSRALIGINGSTLVEVTEA